MRKIFLAIIMACIALPALAQQSSQEEQFKAWMRNQSRTEVKTIHSNILGADRDYTVYLPAGYEAQSDRYYPVLYLLHGMNGTNKDWADRGHLKDVMDQLTASG